MKYIIGTFEKARVKARELGLRLGEYRVINSIERCFGILFHADDIIDAFGSYKLKDYDEIVSYIKSHLEPRT